MARYQIEHGRRAHRSPATRITIVVIVLLLLVGARSLASYAIEVKWWKELGQFNTWLKMLYYGLAPLLAATLVAFAALWLTHARALKFAGTGLGEHRLYARISIARAAAARVSDRGVVDRHLDRRALRRFARPARGRHRVARCRVPTAALVLSLRSAVLPAAAQLRAGGRDLLHPAVLGRGARAGSCATASPTCASRASSTPASSASKAASNRDSCAAPACSCCSRMAVRFYPRTL